MFKLKKNLNDQTYIVPEKRNKIKIEKPTDYLQNVKKEKKSNTKNFVSYAKKNSLIKIGNETKKTLTTISKKVPFY